MLKTFLRYTNIALDGKQVFLATPFLTDLAWPPIFAFQLRKVVETFPTQQNVRSGLIYISVMKQHRA